MTMDIEVFPDGRVTCAGRTYPVEDLWRDDHLYDLVVVVGHNDDPPVPGLGSAIFIHLRRDDHGPTAGCVAFARDDLLDLLGRLTADSRLVVHAAG